MIYKSYNVERNISLIQNSKSILFYGENIGLKKFFKNKIKENFKKTSFLNFTQDEIINNQAAFLEEMNNTSLFEENKIFFIDNCTDKILKVLENQYEEEFNYHTFLFSEALDKKSKLRNLYEKSKDYGSIACYQDNQITIEKLILEKLKGFRGVTRENVNLIIESSSLDRAKLENELEKIMSLFKDKSIETNKLISLLNNPSNDSFNELRDEAIKGNKYVTNSLLNNTVIDPDKSVYYLSLLNQRLKKLEEILVKKKDTNIETIISTLKPPVFWKEKPNLLLQAKKWKLENIKKALNEIYELEIKIKSNSNINKNILVKNQVLNLCLLANS